MHRSLRMLMPAVERYMTREPYFVCSTDKLEQASALMRNHRIRHLPVIDDGRLVGLISDRDLHVVQAVPGSDLAQLEVSRVMAPPNVVWSETPIDEVSSMMADRQSDCVVVKGGHGIEGIFTATDALQALAELVRRATV